jgi:hypothetical protein
MSALRSFLGFALEEGDAGTCASGHLGCPKVRGKVS